MTSAGACPRAERSPVSGLTAARVSAVRMIIGTPPARRPAALRWARVRGFAVPPASHRGEADARLAANWSVPGSHFSTGTNSRQPVAFPRVVLSPSERGRSARRTVVHHRRAGTTRYPTAARSPVRSADHQARLVSTSATRRSGGYPHPCPDTLCGYLFTKGYCIEIVVRNLVQQRLPQSRRSNAGDCLSMGAILEPVSLGQGLRWRLESGTRRGEWTEPQSVASVHSLPLSGADFSGARWPGETVEHRVIRIGVWAEVTRSAH